MGGVVNRLLLRAEVNRGPDSNLATLDPATIIGTEPNRVADKVYLPQQRVKRGKAGYKGDPAKYVVVDPDTGNPVKDSVEPIKSKRGRPKKNP